MEDDIKKMKMKDDLNKMKMEDDLNINQNQPNWL